MQEEIFASLEQILATIESLKHDGSLSPSSLLDEFCTCMNAPLESFLEKYLVE